MSLWIRSGVILAVAGVVAAAPAAAQTAGARCNTAVNSQDWDGVVADCPAALAELPSDHPFYETFRQSLAYAYQTRCQAAAGASDWDATITYCAPAAESFPESYILNFFLGLAYQDKQEWGTAGPYMEAFVQAAQADPQGRSQLGEQITIAQRAGGLALARVGAGDRAVPLLQAAAAANASDVEVQYRLGIGLLQVGDVEGAERALGAVIDNVPDLAAANLSAVLFIAGQLSYNAGDYPTADSRLSQYLQAEPGGSRAPDAHYMLAQALQGTDQERAVTHYQGFLGAMSDPADARLADAHYALGTIYYNRDDCANAEQHYRQLMEIAPDHASAAQVQESLTAIAEGACSG